MNLSNSSDSPREIVGVEALAPDLREPVCVLDLITNGISGDDFALSPEDYAGFELKSGTISAICGTCAMKVCVTTVNGSDSFGRLAELV